MSPKDDKSQQYAIVQDSHKKHRRMQLLLVSIGVFLAITATGLQLFYFSDSAAQLERLKRSSLVIDVEQIGTNIWNAEYLRYRHTSSDTTLKALAAYNFLRSHLTVKSWMKLRLTEDSAVANKIVATRDATLKICDEFRRRGLHAVLDSVVDDILASEEQEGFFAIGDSLFWNKVDYENDREDSLRWKFGVVNGLGILLLTYAPYYRRRSR